MSTLLSIISTIKIIIIALLKNIVAIFFAGLFLFLIFKFIELVWLKWFLAIMTSGAFFYSIFDDMNTFIQKKALDKLKKLDPEIRERVMRKHRDTINK